MHPPPDAHGLIFNDAQFEACAPSSCVPWNASFTWGASTLRLLVIVHRVLRLDQHLGMIVEIIGDRMAGDQLHSLPAV